MLVLGVGIVVDGQDLIEVIDMVVDQMVVKVVGWVYCVFEIDYCVIGELVECGQVQCFGGGVGLEGVGVECDYGQVYVVDGDVFIKLYGVEWQVVDVEGEVDVVVEGFVCGYMVDVFDDFSK